MTEGIVHAFDADGGAGPPALPIDSSDPHLAYPLRLPPGLAGLAAAQIVPALVERRRLSGSAADRGQGAEGLGPDAVGRFADLLFDGMGSECEAVALDLLAATGDPQFVVARLLEPAAVEIGLRWCADTDDFLRVTYASSRLQRLFWRMVRDCPPPAPSRPARSALLGPVPGEQHTFGLSVVEDALRRAGWEVDTCLPGEEDEMLRLVADTSYSFVGLSLGGEHLLTALTRSAGRLRRRSRNREIRVIAGGRLFHDRPLLALQAGADHACADAASAVRLAESFLEPMPSRCQMPVAAE